MDFNTGIIQNNGISSQETSQVSSKRIYFPSSKDNFVKGAKTTVTRPAINITAPSTAQFSPKLLLRVYNNPKFIKSLMDKNPQIAEKLKAAGVENIEINTNNINDMINSHITTTTAIALGIANELGLSAADKKTLEQAAIFHDFGKVLMPEEIINKPGKLDEKEREIINTHAEIGADLLEAAGMNKQVTDIIRNHHNPDSRDLLCNILSVADIYSALREERSYKKPMSAKEAFQILDPKAAKGEVSTEVVNTLKHTTMGIPA